MKFGISKLVFEKNRIDSKTNYPLPIIPLLQATTAFAFVVMITILLICTSNCGIIHKQIIKILFVAKRYAISRNQIIQVIHLNILIQHIVIDASGSKEYTFDLRLIAAYIENTPILSPMSKNTAPS